MSKPKLHKVANKLAATCVEDVLDQADIVWQGTRLQLTEQRIAILITQAYAPLVQAAEKLLRDRRRGFHWGGRDQELFEALCDITDENFMG